MTVPGTLEATLAAAERQAEAALKVVATATGQLRKVRAAAQAGQLRDLRRALSVAESAAADLMAGVKALHVALDVDEQEHISSGAYTKELLAAAGNAGVAMFEQDDLLLCYPSLVRVLAADSAVEIDKVRERRIRPSVLVRLLASAQERAPRFKPESFLDSLRSAYELTVSSESKKLDAIVRLVDVWSVLTLLPGQAREYSKQEFARDLYLLDQSGVITTPRSPRQLRLSASTGTKSAGMLITVARSGQQQRYWGVSFTAPEAF